VASKFRKKPVVIEAVQWNGCNLNEVRAFMRQRGKLVERRIRIFTLEGAIYADEQDWIIKGVAGEFYPCKPEIFAATYSPEPTGDKP
jgi:hypothetical protein